MPESNRKFSYSVAIHKIAITLVISLALTLFMTNASMDNQGSLYLLDPQEATLLFWGVAALSLIVSVVAGLAACGALARPPRVELGSVKVCVPKASLLGGQIGMPCETIDEISRRQVTRCDEMLVIKSTRGESRLLSDHFRSPS